MSSGSASLERFNRFEGADLAARIREVWQDRLDRPLPAHGVGLAADDRLELLSDPTLSICCFR